MNTVDSFDERVAEYLEGQLDAAGMERLAEEVRGDAALRRRFLELAGVDGLLRAQLAPDRLGDELVRRIDLCLVGRDQEERTAEQVLKRIEGRSPARMPTGTRSSARITVAMARSRRPMNLWPLLAATALVAILSAAYLAGGFGRGPAAPKTRLEPSVPGQDLATNPATSGADRPPASPGTPPGGRDAGPSVTGRQPPDLTDDLARDLPPRPPAPAPEIATSAPPAAPDDAKTVPATPGAVSPGGATPARTTVKPATESFARIERVQGDVRPTGPGKAPARAEDRIPDGQGLLTGGFASAAVVKFADGTSLALGPDTEIRDLHEHDAEKGKRFFLVRGMLSAEVAAQPADRPMILTAPQGEVKVIGTSFRVVVDAEPGGTMRLEVRNGKVRLTRARDGRSSDVTAGQFAEVAPGAESLWPRRVLTVPFQDGVSPVAQYAGTRDTYVSEHKSVAAKNNGTSPILVADGDTADSGQPLMDRSALIRWDLSAIPRNATVVWAEVGIQVVNESGGRPFGMYELKREWVETQATWLLASTGVPWQKPGALGDQDRAPAVLGTLAPAVNGSCAVPLSRAGLAAVQSWIANPAANHGLIVADTENGDALIFKSRKATPPAERPRLTVSFVLP